MRIIEFFLAFISFTSGEMPFNPESSKVNYLPIFNTFIPLGSEMKLTRLDICNDIELFCLGGDSILPTLVTGRNDSMFFSGYMVFNEFIEDTISINEYPDGTSIITTKKTDDIYSVPHGIWLFYENGTNKLFCQITFFKGKLISITPCDSVKFRKIARCLNLQ